MSKKQDALNKAKESGKKIVEGGKELGKGTVQVVVGTSGAVGYTLTSGYEKGVSMVSEVRESEEGIPEKERRKRRDSAEKYNEKAKIHIAEAGIFGKAAVKGARKIIKGGAKVIGHTAKGGYHLIDAGDKAIGEKIEKKQLKKGKRTGKFSNFFRDNILKLLIAASATGYGGYKTIDSMIDKNEDKIEVVETLNEKEKFLIDFFNSPDVLKDLKSSGKEWEDKWEDRYLGNDDAWNNMWDGFGFAERKKVIEGMCRMVESGDLEMVLNKADEAGVPRQCVFLALAESGWQAGADSGVAGGYRQFTKASGKLFGLVDDEGNDYRSDPEKSTDAAMKHLKENYSIVSKYAKDLGYNLSESDKWIFAFYMYNGSPKLVKKGMISCKGDANEYSEKLQSKKKENNNYVPRILGIQNALQQIFKENGYDIAKIKSVHLNENIVKTEADLMFEDYIKKEWFLTDIEKTKQLDEIELKYKQEYEESVISEKYYKGAIRVISEARPSARKEEEEDEE